MIADGAARDPFLDETGHLRPQVVAHEIELMLAIALSGMAGEFRGWRGKDQPSTAGIDGGKAKHVPEKGPVGLGVACVDDGMHACNHGHLHRCGAVVLFLVGEFRALEPPETAARSDRPFRPPIGDFSAITNSGGCYFSGEIGLIKPTAIPSGSSMIA